MAFRTVIITNPARLHARKEQLEVHQEDVYRVPLDDIVVLLLESPDVVFSSACLSKLADRGIAVITCDNKFMPCAYLSSNLPHSRQTKMAQKQFGMSQPLKKRIWQRIIQAKIDNQADCLAFYEIDGSDQLHQYASQVNSGDTSNRESLAARYYFPRLFLGHSRSDENVINDALNYSYSIVRSIISRSIVAHGLYPPLGIHHKNEFNNYNLSDDLIEPFRPIIDLFVRTYPPRLEYLSTEDRHAYVNLAHLICWIDDKHMSISSAAELMTSSFVEVLNTNDFRKLTLPSVDGVTLKESIK